MGDHLETHLGTQRLRLFIIPSVSANTAFAPQTKKEISVCITLLSFSHCLFVLIGYGHQEWKGKKNEIHTLIMSLFSGKHKKIDLSSSLPKDSQNHIQALCKTAISTNFSLHWAGAPNNWMQFLEFSVWLRLFGSSNRILKFKLNWAISNLPVYIKWSFMQMLKEIAWHRLDELVPACDEMITRSVNGLKLYMVAPFLKLVYFPVLILNILLSIIFFVCLSFFCVPDVYDMNDVIIHFQYFLFCGGIPSFVFFCLYLLSYCIFSGHYKHG